MEQSCLKTAGGRAENKGLPLTGSFGAFLWPGKLLARAENDITCVQMRIHIWHTEAPEVGREAGKRFFHLHHMNVNFYLSFITSHDDDVLYIALYTAKSFSTPFLCSQQPCKVGWADWWFTQGALSLNRDLNLVPTIFNLII